MASESYAAISLRRSRLTICTTQDFGRSLYALSHLLTHSPYKTLLLPLIVPAYTDGWSFPRRPLPQSTPKASASHLTAKLHAPELADGLVSPEEAQRLMRTSVEGGETGDEVHSKYVVGGDGDLTDDEEGGGGWMEWDDGE
jgi:hypothetical protein